MKLQGPHNNGGFTHGGKTYEPDADGCIDVPPEITDFALSHGFAVIPAAPIPTTPAGKTGTEGTMVNFSKLTKKQLVAFAKENLNLELDEAKTAKELIAAIEAAMEAKQAERTEGGKEAGAE